MKKFTYSINIEIEADNEDNAREQLSQILENERPDIDTQDKWKLRKTSEDGISYDLETGRIEGLVDPDLVAAAQGQRAVTEQMKEKASGHVQNMLDLRNNEKGIEGTQLILKTLNDAFEMDPVSVHTLLCNRVECSKDFAINHPYIECTPTPIDPDRYHVGTLGYINAILSAFNQARICMVFGDPVEKDGPRPMIGFDIYEQDKPQIFKIKEFEKYVIAHEESLSELFGWDELSEEEIEEEKDKLDRDRIIYRLSTLFFDNDNGTGKPSLEIKKWVRTKFPDLYKEALEGYLDGHHDT